jgi:cation:H+ antiporter
MFFILIGGILLFFGAEGLVRGSVSLALRVGIHPLVAGLTVVAFGTSAPELSVSMASAFEGRGAIAIGNIIGSNIFNIAVILGIAAMIQPMKIHLDVLKRDIPVMLVVALIGGALVASGNVTRLSGSLLFIALLGYLIYTVRAAKRDLSGEQIITEEAPKKPSASCWLDVVFVLGGLGLLVYGADMLVEGATAFAKGLGVSDAVIGLTVVAAGTSLPELATSLVAAFKKESDIAIGNVVGSNIFNILGILGLTAVVSGTMDASEIGLRDSAVMLGLSALLLPFALTGRSISRVEGLILVLCYGAYLFLLWPK